LSLPFFICGIKIADAVSFRFFPLRVSPIAWALIGFVLLFAALTSDSIDMMESQTWDYARHDTFAGFRQELAEEKNQESHMPLAMFSYWVWGRIFGTGEYAMRSLNLVWAAVILAALARVGRVLSIPWLPLLFAVQPFVWYSMNHARTPMMQMAGGTLILAGSLGFLRRAAPDGVGGILLCLGVVILSGANMYGLVPLVAVALALTAHGAWKRLRLPFTGKFVAFVTGTIVLLLAGYYLLTVLRGIGSVQHWAVSPANLFFVGYEFLGYSGFGPGRQELRAVMKGLEPAGTLLPFLPGYLILSASYFAVALAAMKSWLTREACLPVGPVETRPTRSFSLVAPWMMGLGVVGVSLLLLYFLASLTAQPFWGRHLSGAFPFWVLALGITIHWSRQGLWRKAGRLVGVLLAFLLLISALFLRTLPWHRHDDYRGAAAEALRISARGGSVLWAADSSGGVYYGLSFAENPTDTTGSISLFLNTPEIGNPQVIILSRPDIFDRSGILTQRLLPGDYKKTRTLQAFEIWERVEN
jgi:hypothetical protein